MTIFTYPERVAFTVPGEPIPQGSLKGFCVGGRAVLTSDNPRTKAWRQKVAQAAREAHDGDPWTGPVKVRLTFGMPRPAGHYRTGKNAALLRDKAPWLPTVKPDLDKLCRALFDAITGVVFVDDAQVIHVTAVKTYALDAPGVEVLIERVELP